MDYEWDETKAESNARKHKVQFEEAASVFDDPEALFLEDSQHGDGRYVVLGSSARQRVLFVVHVEIHDDLIRIISARKATPHERRRYEEGE